MSALGNALFPERTAVPATVRLFLLNVTFLPPFRHASVRQIPILDSVDSNPRHSLRYDPCSPISTKKSSAEKPVGSAKVSMSSAPGCPLSTSYRIESESTARLESLSVWPTNFPSIQTVHIVDYLTVGSGKRPVNLSG